MANSDLFRKSSLDRISSPDELNDYLRVTNPTVWVLLVGIIVLLTGAVIWASFLYIGSFAEGTAQVENGVMTIRFEDETFAGNVEPGMDVAAGETHSVISSVGRSPDGTLFARADTTLPDGEYVVQVKYKEIQLLKLLLN